MPLRKGSSRQAISHNVKEMVHSWEKNGKLGTSHPSSKKKAVKQAVAISLRKAGKSKYQKSGRKSKHATAKKRSAKAVKLVHSRDMNPRKNSYSSI